MKYFNRQITAFLLFYFLHGASNINAEQGRLKSDTLSGTFTENVIRLEYIKNGRSPSGSEEIPLSTVISSGDMRNHPI